jgi:hypothetical protein
MKAPGEAVTLRLAWGDPPEPGDMLVMHNTGRKYGVIDVRGKRLDCVVLHESAEPVGGRTLPWKWERRYGRKRR